MLLHARAIDCSIFVVLVDDIMALTSALSTALLHGGEIGGETLKKNCFILCLTVVVLFLCKYVSEPATETLTP
jgi:hypothetical protein